MHPDMFIVGKYYRYTSMRRGRGWRGFGHMDFWLDGNPRKCIACTGVTAQFEGGNDRPFIYDLIDKPKFQLMERKPKERIGVGRAYKFDLGDIPVPSIVHGAGTFVVKTPIRENTLGINSEKSFSEKRKNSILDAIKKLTIEV